MNPDDLYPKADLKIKHHNTYAVEHYPERIKYFKENPLDFGDIVFLGNSITEVGGDWSANLGIPNAKNRGISGDITDGVLKRLDEIIYYKPKMVFMLIGINDLDNLVYQKQIPSTAYIANNILEITEIIHKNCPETKIYVQTILPALDNLLLPKILEVNTIIKTNESNKPYEVIDLFAAFVEGNAVKQELYRDRLHLNANGYKTWINVLKPYYK